MFCFSKVSFIYTDVPSGGRKPLRFLRAEQCFSLNIFLQHLRIIRVMLMTRRGRADEKKKDFFWKKKSTLYDIILSETVEHYVLIYRTYYIHIYSYIYIRRIQATIVVCSYIFLRAHFIYCLSFLLAALNSSARLFAWDLLN